MNLLDYFKKILRKIFRKNIKQTLTEASDTQPKDAMELKRSNEVTRPKEVLTDKGIEETPKQEGKSRNEFIKEIQNHAKEDFIPQQWQRNFFIEIGLEKYFAGTFSRDYLLSIPEISKIKNEEDVKNAKELYVDKLNGNILHFKDFNVTFSQDEKSYQIKTEGSYEDNKNIEIMVYDIESGVEIKRALYNSFSESYTIYKRYKNDMRRVVMYAGKELKDVKVMGEIDLSTNMDADIGTLDATTSTKTKFTFHRDIVDGIFEQEDLVKEKIIERIKKSKDPEACIKYVGKSLELENTL